jgi:hypothetical protein
LMISSAAFFSSLLAPCLDSSNCTKGQRETRVNNTTRMEKKRYAISRLPSEPNALVGWARQEGEPGLACILWNIQFRHECSLQLRRWFHKMNGLIFFLLRYTYIGTPGTLRTFSRRENVWAATTTCSELFLPEPKKKKKRMQDYQLKLLSQTRVKCSTNQ